MFQAILVLLQFLPDLGDIRLHTVLNFKFALEVGNVLPGRLQILFGDG